jgi:SAM-dependent methyltransferase
MSTQRGALPEGPQPRWFTEPGPGHSQAYVERFRQLAADGTDIVGEARLLDAMLAPGSRVLDAGCGPGRVGAELYRRGHTVVGVDVDPTLVAAAREDHPGPDWLVADLATLDLPGTEGEFDAVVCAGNVLPYLAPNTERQVLMQLYTHVRPDGFGVFGFGLARGYSLTNFDTDAATSGWRLEHRFATWDLRPFDGGADFAVSVLRRPPVD